MSKSYSGPLDDQIRPSSDQNSLSLYTYVKGDDSDLRKNVERDELDRIRRELHNVLWGGGRYQGNEIFLLIVNIILSKIYDEKVTEERKSYRFQVFSNEPAERTVSRINELYICALKTYLNVSDEDLKYRDIRKIGDKRVDERQIRFVVEKFQEISFRENSHDMLGDFFETFLRDEFKQNKGQFFTHQNIVDFIIKALDIEDLTTSMINEGGNIPDVLDPSCGSGTFLVQAMKQINSIVSSAVKESRFKASTDEKNRSLSHSQVHSDFAWAGKHLFGLDFNEDLALASKVNMIMHGDGSANVEASDALSSFSRFRHPKFRLHKMVKNYDKPVNEEFDVIITNPPFSIDLDKETGRELSQNFTKTGKGNSENLFIERWYQFLKPYGRVGAVLPESVLDTKENRTLRLFIYKHFWIRAVVSLPYHAFQPFTSTKTSILFLQKKPAEEVKVYDDKWNHFCEKFDRLESRFNALVETVSNGKREPERQNSDNFREILSELLISGIEASDEGSSVEELRGKYSDLLSRENPLGIEKEWWVFSKVSAELDYPIFMASAEEVGYKRLRTVRKRPNDLYAEIENNGETIITVDKEDPKKILDHIRRNVEWSKPPS